MNRFNRALAKAGQIAQQHNEDVQRTRQQQQARHQQQNHRLSQQQYPPQQYHAANEHDNSAYDRPPPPPPPPRPSDPSRTSSTQTHPAVSPPQPAHQQTSLISNDDIFRAEAALEQLKQQHREQVRLAEAEIARLRAEQAKQQQEAETQIHAAKVEAERPAASELRRLQAERDDALMRSQVEVNAMQRENERIAAVELQKLQAQQQEAGRDAAKMLAAREEAEHRVMADMQRLQGDSQEDRVTFAEQHVHGPAREAEQAAAVESRRLEVEQEKNEKEAERIVRQLEEDRKAAEKLAAEFDAELREAEMDMERMKLARSPPAEEHPPTPPLPPRTYQQPSPSPAAPLTAPLSAAAPGPSQSESTPKYLKTLPPLSPGPPTRHISGITPIKDCPESQPLDINLEFFTHDAAPQFTICTRCYVDHIWPSPFKNSFKLTTFPTKEPRGCFFGVTRVKEHLWPQAVETKSLTKLLEYMGRRPGIVACRKEGEVKEMVWYETDECQGLAICPACYEDQIVDGPFEGRFKLEHVPGPVTCDMAVTYVRRMYDKFAYLNDWKGFCKEAYSRIRFPPCPKSKTVSGPPSWFYPKNGPEGLKICVGCFCDHFLDTSSENEFIQKNDGSEFSCSMGLMRIHLLAQEATRRKDQTVWWKQINVIASNLPCDPAGTKTSQWFTLPSTPRGFAVCGGCMAGVVEPLTASEYFVPATGLPATQPFLCAFNEHHPRLGQHFMLFLEMVLTGNNTSLSNFAQNMSHVKACPRLHYDNGKEHTWWGWQDAPICEECYRGFAEGLHPNPPFEMNSQFIADSRMCDLYSPRMRGLYKEACSTGDFATFLRLARERRQVYLDCYMPAQQYLTDMKIAAMQAQTLGVSGTAFKSMGWTQDATMGHSYTLGNPMVGYGHVNELAFQGAVYDRQAADLRAQVSNPVKQAQMNELNNRWLAVE